MNSSSTVFGNFTILENKTLSHHDKWMREMHAIDPKYIPSTKWEDNKTLIYNYRAPTTHSTTILGLDILLKEAVLVIPDHVDLTDGMLKEIIDYLVCTIKTICPYHVANEMGFRLTVYMTPIHKNIDILHSHTYLTKYNTFYCVSLLGDSLPSYMKRFELNFKFNNEWQVLPNIRQIVNEPAGQLGCFNQPPRNPFAF